VQRFDLIVVGGGSAGATVALVLARVGWRVAILERGRAALREVGETLAAQAGQALRALGLWEDFCRHGHRPAYARQSRWGSDEVFEQNALYNPYGTDFHLDRARFDDWLLAEAEQAGAVVERRASVRHVAWSDDDRCWAVTRDQEQRGVLKGSTLVDATGHSAWLSRRLGATRSTYHGLVGAVRWFRGTREEHPILVEAARDGWWYSAPLPDAVRVAVWMALPHHRAGRAGKDAAVWSECLNAAPFTRSRLEGATPLGPPRTRLTGPALTDWEDRRPWLPVGDARFSLDPLSGQGIRMALESGLAASQALSGLLSGEARALERYRAEGLEEFRKHAVLRRDVYRAGNRWPDSDFWRWTTAAEPSL